MIHIYIYIPRINQIYEINFRDPTDNESLLPYILYQPLVDHFSRIKRAWARIFAAEYTRRGIDQWNSIVTLGKGEFIPKIFLRYVSSNLRKVLEVAPLFFSMIDRREGSRKGGAPSGSMLNAAMVECVEIIFRQVE